MKNAEKFTSKGFVHIGVEYNIRHKLLTVAVKDTGAGFKPEEKLLLFTKFGKM